MSSYTVKKYQKEDYPQWNELVAQSKNGTFLFHRDFMEYHSHRFEDHSLLLYNNTKLVAVFPANLSDGRLYSHQGLTYGGFIYTHKLKFKEVLQCFTKILEYCVKQKIAEIILKKVPTIYHTIPADEIDYILFLLKAQVIESTLSSTISLSNPIKIQSNRIEGYKKALKNGLIIREEKKFDGFWNTLLIPNLEKRHQTTPVHSLEEIERLSSMFPNNIRQFNVYDQEHIVCGTTIFDTKKVAKVQYIATNANRQQLGGLDYLFKELIEKVFEPKAFFDFGISNTENGLKVNAGLHYWKETYGGRGIIHTTYRISTQNHKLLAGILV